MLFVMHPIIQLHHMDMILPNAVDIEIVPGNSFIDKLILLQHSQGGFIPGHHIGLQTVQAQSLESIGLDIT